MRKTKALLLAAFSALPLFAALPQAQAAYTDPINYISFLQFQGTQEPNPIDRNKPRWYQIEIGYTSHSEPPPGEEFIVDDLPPVFLRQAKKHSFQVMLGQRSQQSDNTLIEHSPNGSRLREPFAIGEAVYATVSGFNQGAASVSIFLYDVNNVKWHGNNYELEGFSWKGEWRLPLNKWLVVSRWKKTEETIIDSEVTRLHDYRYAFVRISRI